MKTIHITSMKGDIDQNQVLKRALTNIIESFLSLSCAGDLHSMRQQAFHQYLSFNTIFNE